MLNHGATPLNIFLTHVINLEKVELIIDACFEAQCTQVLDDFSLLPENGAGPIYGPYFLNFDINDRTDTRELFRWHRLQVPTQRLETIALVLNVRGLAKVN